MRDSKEGQFVLAAGSISESDRIKYLLDLLSPAERELIESEYFEDEDAFQQMLTAEDDLIDAYARGDLTNEERQRFEKHFGSSLHGRDRVQFARAFTGAVFEPPKVDPMRSGTFPDLFKIFQGRDFFRTATSAAAIVLVGMLVWQINYRWRTTNGIRPLRAGPAEVSKPTETLEQSVDPEQPQTLAPPAPRAVRRAQPESPAHRERTTSLPKFDRLLSEGKTEPQKFEMLKVGPGEALINTQDATLGNNFENKKITQLPLNANNVSNLLSLQPGITRGGYIAGERTDQANVTLNGVDVSEKPLNTYYLTRNTNSNGQIAIGIPNSLSWIRFRVALAGVAIHEDYRMTIKTKDGHPKTSIDWTEPLTPNQTFIDTPVILTSDLPAGDYMLLLMSKESDGSFVKSAEYAFTVIKY